jgi:hypothetical protein
VLCIGLMATAVSPTVRIWQPLAHIHFHSARFLCKKAFEVEALHNGSPQSSAALTNEYMAYVTGSIFTAVAFLEALINETFARPVGCAKGDPPDGVLRKLPSTVVKSMACVWENGVDWDNESSLHRFLTDRPNRQKPPRATERWYILDKFQLALYLADRSPYSKPFMKDSLLWADITLLKDLRNSLTHHRPEWVASRPGADPYKAEKEETTRLLRALRKRECTNALYPGESSIITVLGAKCASWQLAPAQLSCGHSKTKCP